MNTPADAPPAPAPIPADLARALQDRFDLRDVLGRGGMATVYIAFDRKHQRDVAVKVLRPDIAASIGADRFLKEIQIVARMVHPHILSLHDSGAADGFVYYVMPYIDGGSMRELFAREQRLTRERAIAIAEPIADALTYAHGMGVLHRDIKPENVLFARAHPIVADFGIAKAVSSATSGAQLTRTGISLGTPGYMSPEQAAGFNDVDVKTDVYALAILVYEMIVGEIPGRWVTEESTREGRFMDVPAAHRLHLSAAGATVEGALVRALALRQDQRTGTPGQFIEELRGTMPGTRRTYRPDEVERIVNRAAEMEVTNPTSSGAMTMGGIEQIARDVGIDADLVRSAARELSPRTISREASIEPPRRNRFLGGPTRLIYERIIPGELDEADYGRMVEEVRIHMKEVGTVSQLGRSFTWALRKAGSQGRDVEVAVSVHRSGRTRIQIQENLDNLIFPVWGLLGGVIGGMGVIPFLGSLIGALHWSPYPVLILGAPAWLGFFYSLSHTSYHYAVTGRHRELESLADKLATLARELIGEQRLLESKPERLLR